MSSTSNRNNGFAVLRLLLAGAVIIGHSPEIIDGNRSREPLTRLFQSLSLGRAAVDGFFVLSGFLLAASWLARPSLSRYVPRRVLRILPGAIVASLISIVLVGSLGAADPELYLGAIDWGRSVARMLTLAPPATPPTFDGTFYPEVNIPMWTIRYEFLCYAGIPILGFLGVLQRPHWMLVVLLVSLASCAALAVWLRIAHPPAGDNVVNFWVHLHRMARFWPFFCCGAALASWEGLWRPAAWHTLVAGGLVVAAMWLLGPRAELVLPLPFAYAIVDVGARRLPFTHTWFRSFDASYGTYLYAWPIQKLLVHFFPAIGCWTLAAVALVLAFCAGSISWLVIERPAIRLSEWLSEPRGHLRRQRAS